MFWKALSLWTTLFFYHLGVDVESTHENPKMIWVSCASLCSFFSFSSSHLTASPWNLFQSDWQHRRAFWNARYSQSKTYFHILPRRKSALTRRCSSLPTSRYPRCEQGVESGRCAAYRGLLVSRFDPHCTPWSRQGAVLHFTHVRMKVLFYSYQPAL